MSRITTTTIGLVIAAGGLLAGAPVIAGHPADPADREAVQTGSMPSGGARDFSGRPLQGGADDAVRKAVRERLENDPDVNIADLEVVVQDGIVTLYGKAATSAEKHIASRYAKDIRGASGVVNGIDVVPGLRETVPRDARPDGIVQQRRDVSDRPETLEQLRETGIPADPPQVDVPPGYPGLDDAPPGG